MINDELISRKAVIDRLQKAQNVFLKHSPLEACGISYAREIIASEVEIPTIEKRPEGEWIIDEEWVTPTDDINDDYKVTTYTCPFCGRVEYTSFDYCRCGADLSKGDEK